MKKLLKRLGIAALVFFAVTFAAYITNADMKLIEKIYDLLIAYHDRKRVEEHI
jgi:FtsH-binding integral membrane protein